MTIKLKKDQKIKVLNGEDVYNVMCEVLLRENKIDRNKEHLWVISLSPSNRILLVELVGLGTVKSIQIHPTEVFSFALQKKAVKIILVHNHPSGETEPSASDKKITDQLQAIGDFIDVPLIDHIIISEKSYFSFEDSGLMAEIRRKSTFDLRFTKINAMLDQIDKLKKSRESELKRNTASIKRMSADGHPSRTIAKYLGLTVKEVNKIVSGK